MLGQPLERDEKARLERASIPREENRRSAPFRSILDNHCLIGIEINAESRVKSLQGPARPGWSRMGGRCSWSRSTTRPASRPSWSPRAPTPAPCTSSRPTARSRRHPIRPADVVQRWADVIMFNDRPLKRSLSGLSLEYRIVQIS